MSAFLDPFLAALAAILAWPTIGIIVASAVFGLTVGAIPGLTATMAVALIIPFTFFMGDVPALAAIVTLSACAIFAGDIPATLVRIPGTPASAAYVDDAYALTNAGRSHESLGLALVASVGGGLIGAILLIAAAPRLASVALSFTTYEYFWLTLLGLSSAAVASQGSLWKAALALITGLLLSTVGLGEVHGTPRFTFGYDELIAGVNFIPAMIGLFGFSEVLRNVAGSLSVIASAGGSAGVSRSNAYSLRSLFGPAWRRLRARPLPLLRSGVVGAIVGILPGAGADIAAWISYAVSKRFSKQPSEYGRGALDGLADASSANNAALGGAWIPALVFGIPGDSITAIVIGILLMKNVTPGPEIFTSPRQALLLHSLYVTFILANLLLIPVGYLAIRFGLRLVRIPRRILVPCILAFCIVGAYAINGSYFDVQVMLVMGLLGFVFDRFAVPLGPVVLGIVLGGKLEQTFVQSATKADSWVDFFSRPVSGALGVVVILLWLSPLLAKAVAGAWRRTR